MHLSSTNPNPIQLDHMKDYFVSKDAIIYVPSLVQYIQF